MCPGAGPGSGSGPGQRPARTTLLLAALALATLPALPQTPADPAAILHRVDDHYNRLKTLRCGFTQHFTGLGADRTETGTLLLGRPGRMRWTYTEPAGKLFVLDGKYAWAYTAGAPQVQRVAAKQMDDLRSPLRFLLGRTQLERELRGITVAASPAGFHIAGTPRGLEDRVAAISLDVTPTGVIQAIRLEERDGSVTEFQFRDTAENLPLPPDTFRFQIPPGIPVVDALPPL